MNTLIKSVQSALSSMILSASGWRKIFAVSGNEQDSSSGISNADSLISAAAADAFYEFLVQSSAITRQLHIVLGTDTRPTGSALAHCMVPVLESLGVFVRFVGVSAAPEIMAYSRDFDGFIYISASHNPIGHNGFKFGLNDGGVIDGQKSAVLIEMFKTRCISDTVLTRLSQTIQPHLTKNTLQDSSSLYKTEALFSYNSFIRNVITNSADVVQQSKVLDAVSSGISHSSLSIVADMNGSARTVSIDKALLASVGARLYTINNTPGCIAHEIIPEPENLVYCADEMKRLQSNGITDAVLGYMPDCDGDRGNIVYWDHEASEPKILGAQEVFSLAVLSELAYLRWLGVPAEKMAVAVNDPTSMRVDEIAHSFNTSVFRAEVGEANVVNLARSLRKAGWTVRILGEGSNGGNITHPSAVRDPLSTIFALIKLLTLRSFTDSDGRYIPGLFEIWCSLSGSYKMYRHNFTMNDVLKSLPQFTTTGVSEKRAVVDIKTLDHAQLKREYKKQLEYDFRENNEFYESLGLYSWRAFSNNGIIETSDLDDFGKSGRGGLKIVFYDSFQKTAAFVWMRGSGTEPVFRVMCDFAGTEIDKERRLLERHSQLVLASDRASQVV